MAEIVFDIGMHKGEDTSYYLSQGYRVVAIEANPDLIKFCEEEFISFIQSGLLTIIHGAITDSNSKTVKFFVNNRKSEWGTVKPEWANRNSKLGAESDVIEVPVVDIEEILLLYGCPLYMKIDIEGMDLACLKKIAETTFRPRYLSIESEKRHWELLELEFHILSQMGYQHFALQQMANINRIKTPKSKNHQIILQSKFSSKSSGPFGEDLTNKWLNKEETIHCYRRVFKMYKYFGDFSLVRKLPFSRHILALLGKLFRTPLPGWYDTHAKLY